MVDSIRPTYRPVPIKSTANKVKESSPVETSNDQKTAEPYVVTRDRRKQKDRRARKTELLPVYDMRSGRGRRREDQQSKIEIKA